MSIFQDPKDYKTAVDKAESYAKRHKASQESMRKVAPRPPFVKEPAPARQHQVCCICKVPFPEYWAHIASKEHKFEVKAYQPYYDQIDEEVEEMNEEFEQLKIREAEERQRLERKPRTRSVAKEEACSDDEEFVVMIDRSEELSENDLPHNKDADSEVGVGIKREKSPEVEIRAVQSPVIPPPQTPPI